MQTKTASKTKAMTKYPHIGVVDGVDVVDTAFFGVFFVSKIDKAWRRMLAKRLKPHTFSSALHRHTDRNFGS